MAQDKRPFRVVIVGGSIAGLSLAIMLERLSVDFVVLEAGQEIAPQLGASITIWPHFARILDQLGCCGIYRDQYGSQLLRIPGLADTMQRRHGYPVAFIQRRMMVQILYDALQHKEQVLVQKKLTHIESMSDGILAEMQDGSTYAGDIIVGGDGMYSAVRKQMHIIGKARSPGYFHQDEYSEVPCTYSCIFGMSEPTKNYENGTTQLILGENHSYAFATAPGGKVFWFLNVKNDQVAHGKNIARYSVEEEHSLAEQHFKDRINEEDTFEDFYKRRIISRLTPLHEYQWKRWYFERIMTIGDACHKLHPITGYGGAAAVEDAAVLASALQRMLSQKMSPSLEDIKEVFAETQNAQEKRTSDLIKQATKAQEFDAMESILSPLIARYVIPNMPPDAMFTAIAGSVIPGARIDFLPIPERERYVPFRDELPAQPLNRAPIAMALSVLMYTLLFWLACLSPGAYPSPTILTRLGLPERYLNTIVGSLNPSVGDSRDDMIASVLFLAPIIIIWNIEAHRRGNVASLWSRLVVLLFCAALYVMGPEKVLPVYFALAFCNSCRLAYTLTAGRQVSRPVIRASNIVILTAFIVTTALLWSQKIGHAEYGRDNAMWLLLPTGMTVLVQLLAATPILKDPKSTSSETRAGKEYMEPYLDQDYPLITSLYRTLFMLSFLATIFTPLSSGGHGLISANILAYCLQAAFGMRNSGYATNVEVSSAMMVIIVGSIMVGPVPVYIGTLYWREAIIRGLSK